MVHDWLTWRDAHLYLLGYIVCCIRKIISKGRPVRQEQAPIYSARHDRSPHWTVQKPSGDRLKYVGFKLMISCYHSFLLWPQRCTYCTINCCSLATCNSVPLCPQNDIPSSLTHSFTIVRQGVTTVCFSLFPRKLAMSNCCLSSWGVLYRKLDTIVLSLDRSVVL